MNTELLSAELQSILPELVMAGLGLVMLLLAAFRGDNRALQLTNLALVGIALALFALSAVEPVAPIATATAEGGPTVLRAASFNGLYAVDTFALLNKILILVSAALSFVLLVSYLKTTGMDRSELPVLMVFSVLGMMIMVSANNLLILYIGLELLSLPLYVLAAIRRDDGRSSEAGLKYFVLGALSSGIMLYGISLIYGFTGTLGFDSLGLVVAGYAEGGPAAIPPGLTIGLVFVLVGLGFKVSAVPFHMWTPDVYEGAPTAVTAFFTAGPKIAALALMTRLLVQGFGSALPAWQDVVAILAGASMVLGSLAAIPQTNIKRLMAYSSISNIGFALMGVAAGSPAGVEAVVVYMAIYLFMTLGTFAVILSMRRQGVLVERVEDLAGLVNTHRNLALVMVVFMFSLAGIPPLAGFFAKLWVFRAAVDADLIGLAIVGALSSVAAAYYYLRIIKLMVFDQATEPLDRDVPSPLWSVLASTGLVLLLFIVFAAPLLDRAGIAARGLFLAG